LFAVWYEPTSVPKAAKIVQDNIISNVSIISPDARELLAISEALPNESDTLSIEPLNQQYFAELTNLLQPVISGMAAKAIATPALARRWHSLIE
jgi:hypothetical protein